jgi:hypothetical protein
MHTVIRGYAGSKEIADELLECSQDIEAVIGSVPGFIAYYLIKTDDGAMSITICQDRHSCDESTKRATVWLGRNRPALRIQPPRIVEGEVTFQFSRTHAMA